MYCGQYEPGHWSKLGWKLLGYCSGTIAPTASPAFTALTDHSGCPSEYVSGGSNYEAGDKVSVPLTNTHSIVYQCSTDVHEAGWCNQNEPGTEHGWKVIAYCDGTIAPTGSPVFTALSDHSGCPSEYVSGGSNYEAGDKVSVPLSSTHSIVYQCSTDVHEAQWCNQYEPGNEHKLGWKVIAYCDGTIAPTGSPAFTSLTQVGSGCPNGYNSATTYEAGDVVSLVVSGSPNDRVVVYECKSWPSGAYCNAGPDYAPDSANVNYGWTLKGYCDGTIAPTTSPTVYAPAAKCRYYSGNQAIQINHWATGDLSTYVAGTRVRIENRIYKCKGWPYSLWCKMAAYKPEGDSGVYDDAWTSAGDCNGVLAPTTSPSVSPTLSPTAP